MCVQRKRIGIMKPCIGARETVFYCLSEGRELEVSSSARTLKRPGTAWGAPTPSPFPLLAPHVTSRRSNSFSRSSRLSTFYNVCIKIMLMTLIFKGLSHKMDLAFDDMHGH